MRKKLEEASMEQRRKKELEKVAQMKKEEIVKEKAAAAAAENFEKGESRKNLIPDYRPGKIVSHHWKFDSKKFCDNSV